MAMTYDEWKLDTPDRPDEPGHEVDAVCNRYPEPDEDAPRGYKPKPCKGVMSYDPRDAELCCDTCGEAG